MLAVDTLGSDIAVVCDYDSTGLASVWFTKFA